MLNHNITPLPLVAPKALGLAEDNRVSSSQSPVITTRNTWPDFNDSVFEKGQIGAANNYGAGMKFIDMNVPPGMRYRNIYSYVVAALLAPGGYNALVMAISFYLGNTIIKKMPFNFIVDNAGTVLTRSTPTLPSGGAVRANSLILTVPNPYPSEPAAPNNFVILQPFAVNFDFDRLTVDGIAGCINIGSARIYIAVDSNPHLSTFAQNE